MQTFDQALFDLYEAGPHQLRGRAALRRFHQEVRLQIKLQGKEAKDKDLTKGIEHLDIV